MSHRWRRAAGTWRMLVPLTLAFTVVTTWADRDPLSPWLGTAIRQARPDDRLTVWIYLRDKGPSAAGRLSTASRLMSARARLRRATRGALGPTPTIEDLPVDASYVEQVTARVTRVRHASRWLNAVSADATPSQIREVAALPIVAQVDVVRRYRRGPREPLDPSDADRHRPRNDVRQRRGTRLDYGTSLEQLAQLRVPELHDRGLTGHGVIVAVFDSGFPNLSHEVFGEMRIAAEHNFVRGAETVRDSTDRHGTASLSVLGGHREAQLIGPAFGATFLLAITENAESETPVEEDNWTAAAEWADLLGADVISSSLGYLEFDLPFTSYSDRDMDGETAVTTKAAAMAAARGMVVVNSVGNSGLDPNHNTLAAPADGRRVLAIGAVDRGGVRAPFSSVGPTADGRIKPDVSALGIRTKVATTLATDSYAFASGTSFSCPLTAGVVALVLQAHPTYTVDQVLGALRFTASQADAPDNLLGWGIVDAVRAVDAVVDLTGDSAHSSHVEARSRRPEDR